ncbi:primase alpha helix C-terminal domain-containing protein [Streptococcus hyovaginalis]|uniref:primase alpha helix C-terminal domain-containing protein n=1 Tax=Streptococcus hyovaginalis TaxID=149015 RepID=UPI003B3B5D87
MTIYETVGYSQPLHAYDKKPPFRYLKEFKPISVPKGVKIDDYKRQQAPYFISGKIKPNEQGIYKRNNASLTNRDIVLIDYDDLEDAESFKTAVSRALNEFNYMIYSTIKHSPEKPRYRLAVDVDQSMNESQYKATIEEITQAIGLPFDMASLTWSQLQGLPVDAGYFDCVINEGRSYEVKNGTATKSIQTSYKPRTGVSMTMRVIHTLMNGYGAEGGRNQSLAQFVGLLLNKWVDCDVPTAYELARIANEQTDAPLPVAELDNTFRSIVKAESRKRGV